MKVGALIAAVSLVAMPMHARAEFVANRGDWNALTGPQQSTYAMGIFDAVTLNRADVTKADQAVRNGRTACAIDLKLTNADLAKLVTDGYSDPAAWSRPPSVVLQNQLSKVCSGYVSNERSKLGLPVSIRSD